MDLGYFNARVRGLRGRLFRAPDYASFLKTASVQELMTRLKSTGYGPYIERSEARFDSPARVVTEAMKRSLEDTLGLLWDTAPDAARPLLKGILSGWEVFDLKAVLRGVSRGVKREDLKEVLIPVGEFSAGPLNALTVPGTVEEVIGLLRTWGSPYADPLERAYERYAVHRNIIELELALDLFLHGYVLDTIAGFGRDSEIIGDAVSMGVDGRNVMTLFKIAGEGFSREGASSVFLEGGRTLPKHLFLDLSALATREEVVDGLLAEVKDPFIREALSGRETEDPAIVEEAFDDAVERRLYRAAVTEPLSIALGASYIYLKVRETKNLRMLARGKLFHIPPDELMRFLFYRH